MRRKDRSVETVEEIESIITGAKICHIAMVDGNEPYLVAMNYGYLPGKLYFHCATTGRKLDVIKKNNRVCFQMEMDHELIRAEVACAYTMNFRSVVGYGNMSVVDDVKERIVGLNAIMKHYSGKADFVYDDKLLKATSILRIDITGVTGKKKI